MLCRVEEHDNFCELCNSIFSIIDKIIDFIKESNIPNKPDLLYVAKNAREDIFKWVCHSIHQVQQNKAKLDALSSLSETSALCVGLLPKSTSNAI